MSNVPDIIARQFYHSTTMFCWGIKQDSEPLSRLEKVHIDQSTSLMNMLFIHAESEEERLLSMS